LILGMSQVAACLLAWWRPVYRWRELVAGAGMEQENLSSRYRSEWPWWAGQVNYYGRFYRSTLYSLARRIDEHLVRWAMQKYKRLRGSPKRPGHGSTLSDSASPPYSPTGESHTPNIGLWGPDDGRLSRPVCAVRRSVVSLSERGGT
jgi:hypothetical protein